LKQPEFKMLPEAHSEFPFSITLGSWWPLIALLVVAGVAVLVFRKGR